MSPINPADNKVNPALPVVLPLPVQPVAPEVKPPEKLPENAPTLPADKKIGNAAEAAMMQAKLQAAMKDQPDKTPPQNPELTRLFEALDRESGFSMLRLERFSPYLWKQDNPDEPLPAVALNDYGDLKMETQKGLLRPSDAQRLRKNVQPPLSEFDRLFAPFNKGGQNLDDLFRIPSNRMRGNLNEADKVEKPLLSTRNKPLILIDRDGKEKKIEFDKLIDGQEFKLDPNRKLLIIPGRYGKNGQETEPQLEGVFERNPLDKDHLILRQASEQDSVARRLLDGSWLDALNLTEEVARNKKFSLEERTELVDRVAKILLDQGKTETAESLLLGDAKRRLETEVVGLNPAERTEKVREYADELRDLRQLRPAAQLLESEAAQIEEKLKTPLSGEVIAQLRKIADEFKKTAAEIRGEYVKQQSELKLQRAEAAAAKARQEVQPNPVRLDLAPDGKHEFTDFWRQQAIQTALGSRSFGQSDPRVGVNLAEQADKLYAANKTGLDALEKLVRPDSGKSLDAGVITAYTDVLKNQAKVDGTTDYSLVLLKKGTISEKTREANKRSGAYDVNASTQPIGNVDIAIARTTVRDGETTTVLMGVVKSPTGKAVTNRLDGVSADDILVSVNAKHLVEGTKPSRIETYVGISDIAKDENYKKIGDNYHRLVEFDFLKQLKEVGDESGGLKYLELNGHDLHNTIGAAMGLKPRKLSEEERAQLKEGKLELFSGNELKTIKDVEAKLRLKAHGDEKSTKPLKIMPLPVFYDSEKTGRLAKIALFRVEGQDGKPKFVEPVGKDFRYYDSFNDWKDNTAIPAGRLSYFADGKVTAKPNGDPNFVVNRDHKNGIGDNLLYAADIGITVVGTVAAVASFIPGPHLAVTVPIAAGSALYGAGRGGYELYDRAAHGQSIDPTKSKEAFWTYAEIGANLAGFKAARLGSKVMSLERGVGQAIKQGKTVEEIYALQVKLAQAQKAARAYGVAAQYLDTANMAHTGAELYENWNKMSSADQVKAVLQTGYWMAMNAASARQSGGLKNLYGFDYIKTAYNNTKDAAKTVAANYEGANRWLRKDVLDIFFGKSVSRPAQTDSGQSTGLAARNARRRAGHIAPELLFAPLTIPKDILVAGLRMFDGGKRVAKQFLGEMQGLYKAQNKAELDRMHASMNEYYRVFNEIYGRTLTPQDRRTLAEKHQQAPAEMPAAVSQTRDALALNAAERELAKIKSGKEERPLNMPEELQKLRKALPDETRKIFDAFYREHIGKTGGEGSDKRSQEFKDYFDKEFVSGGRVDEKKLVSAFEESVKNQAREAFDVIYAEGVSNPQNAEQIKQFEEFVNQNFRDANNVNGEKLLESYRQGIRDKAEALTLAAFEGELSPNSQHYKNMTQALDNLQGKNSQPVEGEQPVIKTREEAKAILFEYYKDYLKSIGREKADKSAGGTKPDTPFRDFLTNNGVWNSPGADTRTVKDVIKNFNSLTTAADLNTAVFSEGNKVWGAAYKKSLEQIAQGQEPILPKKIVDAIEQVLRGNNPDNDKSFKIDGNSRFTGAREKLSGYINEAVAKSLTTPEEFANFMRLTWKLPELTGHSANSGQDSTNRGAIFERFYHYRLTRNNDAGDNNDGYKPEFAKKDLRAYLDPNQIGTGKMFSDADFGDKHKFIPDRYLADLNAMVNLKTGENTAAAKEEIYLAVALVEAGRDQFVKRQGAAFDLRQKTAAANDGNPPPLTYAYLFATNGKTVAGDEVAKLYGRIRDGFPDKLGHFRFYYQDQTGVIHEYLGPDKAAVRIGMTMNEPRRAATVK